MNGYCTFSADLYFWWHRRMNTPISPEQEDFVRQHDGMPLHQVTDEYRAAFTPTGRLRQSYEEVAQ